MKCDGIMENILIRSGKRRLMGTTFLIQPIGIQVVATCLGIITI